eukprot:scaffold8247_cov258-Pinguiococcus_pyrenoidosus.AAC.2
MVVDARLLMLPQELLHPVGHAGADEATRFQARHFAAEGSEWLDAAVSPSHVFHLTCCRRSGEGREGPKEIGDVEDLDNAVLVAENDLHIEHVIFQRPACLRQLLERRHSFRLRRPGLFDVRIPLPSKRLEARAGRLGSDGVAVAQQLLIDHAERRDADRPRVLAEGAEPHGPFGSLAFSLGRLFILFRRHLHPSEVCVCPGVRQLALERRRPRGPEAHLARGVGRHEQREGVQEGHLAERALEQQHLLRLGILKVPELDDAGGAARRDERGGVAVADLEDLSDRRLPLGSRLVVDLDRASPGGADEHLVRTAVAHGAHFGDVTTHVFDGGARGAVEGLDGTTLVPKHQLLHVGVQTHRAQVGGVIVTLQQRLEQAARLGAPQLGAAAGRRGDGERVRVEDDVEHRFFVRQKRPLLRAVLEHVDRGCNADELAPLHHAEQTQLLRMLALVDHHRSQQEEVLQVPHAHLPRAVRRHQLRRLRQHLDAADGAEVVLQPHDEVLDERVPNQHVEIEAAAEEQAVVLRVREARDALLVAPQCVPVPAGLHVPQANGAVHAAGGDEAQAVELGERQDGVGMHVVLLLEVQLVQRVPLLHLLHVPEEQLAVGRAEAQQTLRAHPQHRGGAGLHGEGPVDLRVVLVEQQDGAVQRRRRVQLERRNVLHEADRCSVVPIRVYIVKAAVKHQEHGALLLQKRHAVVVREVARAQQRLAGATQLLQAQATLVAVAILRRGVTIVPAAALAGVHQERRELLPLNDAQVVHVDGVEHAAQVAQHGQTPALLLQLLLQPERLRHTGNEVHETDAAGVFLAREQRAQLLHAVAAEAGQHG